MDAPAGLARPSRRGYRTVEVDGTAYRTLARPTPAGDVLEVGAELTGVPERVGAVGARLVVVSLVGTAVAGVLPWGSRASR